MVDEVNCCSPAASEEREEEGVVSRCWSPDVISISGVLDVMRERGVQSVRQSDLYSSLHFNRMNECVSGGEEGGEKFLFFFFSHFQNRSIFNDFSMNINKIKSTIASSYSYARESVARPI